MLVALSIFADHERAARSLRNHESWYVSSSKQQAVHRRKEGCSVKQFGAPRSAVLALLLSGGPLRACWLRPRPSRWKAALKACFASRIAFCATLRRDSTFHAAAEDESSGQPVWLACPRRFFS